MTSFLGLDKSGMYIDVDFSGVSVLQVRDKDMVEKRRIVSEKCQKEFVGGVDVQLRTSEHRSMYSYVRLSIDRCTLVRLSIDRCTATVL